MKRRKVREMMQQNSFWCCVPLVTVTSTLKLLREAGFDVSHICAALPIILYPKYDILFIYKNGYLCLFLWFFTIKLLVRFATVFVNDLDFQEKDYSSHPISFHKCILLLITFHFCQHFLLFAFTIVIESLSKIMTLFKKW